MQVDLEVAEVDLGAAKNKRRVDGGCKVAVLGRVCGVDNEDTEFKCRGREECSRKKDAGVHVDDSCLMKKVFVHTTLRIHDPSATSLSNFIREPHSDEMSQHRRPCRTTVQWGRTVVVA